MKFTGYRMTPWARREAAPSPLNRLTACPADAATPSLGPGRPRQSRQFHLKPLVGA